MKGRREKKNHYHLKFDWNSYELKIFDDLSEYWKRSVLNFPHDSWKWLQNFCHNIIQFYVLKIVFRTKKSFPHNLWYLIKRNLGNKKNCNGHDDATEVGSIEDNDKTIEGYFKEVNLGGYSGPGDWWDTGTFTVVLVH